jgi:hypothetical protein
MNEVVSMCCGAGFVEDSDFCSNCHEHSVAECAECGMEIQDDTPHLCHLEVQFE